MINKLLMMSKQDIKILRVVNDGYTTSISFSNNHLNLMTCCADEFNDKENVSLCKYREDKIGQMF